jgi:UDP-2-acetamido-3-amino-2,3-dideoxy-glucuronate N-acetyltransferase
MVDMDKNFISETAIVEDLVSIGGDAKIWHHAHIRSKVTLGANVIIGSNVYIGIGVSVGNNSKIQNNSLIYEPAQIDEGVFVGPGVIFTNDHYPRALNPNETQKGSLDWNKAGVVVRHGASIGAGAICVGPVEIGKWAMIGAGAVVVKDVPNFALVVGVPARQIGWVGKDGARLLEQSSTTFKCPISEKLYYLEGSNLIEENS